MAAGNRRSRASRSAWFPVARPKDNPYSPEKVGLGRFPYVDPRLSADSSVSCASCHSPKSAFTDGAPVSAGIRGQKGGRSAPTVMGAFKAPTLREIEHTAPCMHDGSPATLEQVVDFYDKDSEPESRSRD